MWSYRKRIERDLARWRQEGWVTPEGEVAIRADLSRQGGMGVASVLSMLAAVLLGFAIMSFVAANWDSMSKLVRLGLLFGVLGAVTVAAGALFQRGMEGFGHAATVLGAATFGANIMLISQMYHMDGHAADAILLWAAGALVSGVVLRSGPALGFAMVLVCFWAGWEMGDRLEVYWPFVPAWALVAAAFYWLKWRPGVHFAGLAMAGFIISLGYIWHRGHDHHVVTVLGLALIGATVVGDKLRPDLTVLWPASLCYALIIAYFGMMALQYSETPSANEYIVLAILTLALTLAAIWWGLSAPNRGALWLGYIGFSSEILAIYQKTVGSLMGTSLFFLVAGVLVAALAFMAYRLNERQQAREIE